MPWINVLSSMTNATKAIVCTPAKAAGASKIYRGVHLSKGNVVAYFPSQNSADMRDRYPFTPTMSNKLLAMAE